jgi:CRISPR system Cascade subunit CasE
LLSSEEIKGCGSIYVGLAASLIVFQKNNKMAPSLGFEIQAESLEIRHAGVQTFDLGNGKIVTHNSATYVGKLQVTDRVKFQQSFRKGIGRAKGFGFGLFQIIPLQIQ